MSPMCRMCSQDSGMAIWNLVSAAAGGVTHLFSGGMAEWWNDSVGRILGKVSQYDDTWGIFKGFGPELL